ncbi:MAG: hypothetical protein GTN71_04875 [Anaerolineae bacterium]|nr:hypothetical protein [Gemmatimonadales bacterium]NIO68386.1 hypothetical protein [Anaerolineae bacterium]
MRKHLRGIPIWYISGAVLAGVAMSGCTSSPSDNLPTVTPSVTPSDQSAAASVVVTLTGSDTETCELIFATAGPINGTLSEITDEPCVAGSPNTDSATVTFTSEPGICGPAQGSFTYTTNDGSATSAPATVTVDIPCIEVSTEE